MATDTGIGAYLSLGADINKQKGALDTENREGVVSEKLPELTLKMSDEELVKLTDKWEKEWKESPKKTEWEKKYEENEKYWLGLQFDNPKEAKTRPFADNLIFESLETYLPETTRRNPEPLVVLDETEKDSSGNENPIHTKYVAKVKGRLADIADKNKLRLKLKKGARHWAIFLLGVAKFGWSMDKDMPVVRIIRPKRIILDPDAMIDEDGYSGEYIGEYRKLTASRILSIIGEEKTEDGVPPSQAKKVITELVKDDLGTQINFVEWWTPQYVCWKLDKTILYKRKNPFWNYTEPSTNESVDTYGNVTPATGEVEGINHLASPEMPYRFLTVFNLGDQPMDNTSLIGQNLAIQDTINKRNKQIDRNADDMNGGWVISLARAGLTQTQAALVVRALRRGGAAVIPDGIPDEAIKRTSAPSLPPDVYNDLVDKRNRLRDIFGTRGSSAAGITSEQTVRGKILNRGLDTDRIGGGVSEYLEQWADDWYNWFVQLLYVYDPDFRFIEGARPPKIVISVKEGSLLPKDSTTLANQAIELGTAGKMALMDMFKRLEYPNPEELAANVWLEVNAPHLLYKDNPLVQEALVMQQQAAQAQAQAEQEKTATTHAQGLETEQARTEGAVAKETAKSILNAVPIPQGG